MNLQETAKLLTLISSGYDNRRWDDATVAEWRGQLAGIDYDQAATAVRAHFATTTAWLMPLHIRERVTALRAANGDKCPEHRGESAHNCRPCAGERKARTYTDRKATL